MLRRQRLTFRLHERCMLQHRCDARDVRHGRRLLRGCCDRRDGWCTLLLQGDERSTGYRLACAFLRRTRQQREQQCGKERMHEKRCEVAPRESLAPAWVTRIAFEHAPRLCA
jgi:hypothetical protein